MSTESPGASFATSLGTELAPRMPPPRPPAVASPIVYPESDGKPMADNTKQLQWIFVLYGNLAALFVERLDVFVAGNILWYPEEGHPEVCGAPDVLVAIGRPKGDRAAYKQWEEGNVPPTVVFEVLSPGNTILEMADKLAFYDEHGVEEYYLFNPDSNYFVAYRRGREALRRIWPPESLSPRLGIRFDLSGPEMVVFYPDGQPFLSFEKIKSLRDQAERRADQAEQRANEVRQRSIRLAELSRKARRQEASAAELAELERLEDEASAS